MGYVPKTPGNTPTEATQKPGYEILKRLISCTTAYWVCHISPPKWKYTNVLVGGAFFPPKHSVFLISLNWLLILLFFCLPNYLQVGGLSTTNFSRSVPYYCASFPIAFDIRKQNSRIFLLWGVRLKQNCSEWNVSPMPSGPISVFLPSFWVIAIPEVILHTVLSLSSQWNPTSLLQLLSPLYFTDYETSKK